MEKKEKYLDVVKTVEGLIKRTDWRIKENANIPYSFSNVFFRVSGDVISKFMLSKIYPTKVAKAHANGDLHIHNLYMGLNAYCCGWDLKLLLMQGLGKLPGRVATNPPKHFSTALHHILNFVGIITGEWAGAQAFNSFDTLLAPFIKKDNLNYKQIKQAVQEFVFGLNVTTRWASQSPFSNISLDWKLPEDLANERVILGGKVIENTYSDYQAEMDMINKAFIEIMLQGDAIERVFTFPIPTYNITKDFDWDSENANLLFEMTAKYGIPYFSNFISSDLKPSDIRSMCCRLRLDIRELQRNITGGLFGSANSTGSIGVVTINMPRLGFISKNENQFFERLEELMEVASQSLEIKRKMLNENMKKGLLPYTQAYLGTFENHFSTIGLIGMNEACLNMFGVDIADKSAHNFAIKTLKFMLKKLGEFQRKTGNLYNLEATPAEGTSYRLASTDKKMYPKIITAGKKVPYYTNSTWLPVDKTDDLAFAIRHQEPLQSLYTGGTVLHIFLGERIGTAEACKQLVRQVLEKSILPYITITPTYSICPNHGYLNGERNKCPTCKAPCEVYSRVVGYFRRTTDWNIGKQEEFKQRAGYKEKVKL